MENHIFEPAHRRILVKETIKRFLKRLVRQVGLSGNHALWKREVRRRNWSILIEVVHHRRHDIVSPSPRLVDSLVLVLRDLADIVDVTRTLRYIYTLVRSAQFVQFARVKNNVSRFLNPVNSVSTRISPKIKITCSQ